MKLQGSFPRELSRPKDLIDFLLTRVPEVYLQVEQRRRWTNWDKRLYLSVIKPGDVVLDIGANIGTHAVMFSHLVGRSGRVLAFEPVPPNYDKLHRTFARRLRFPNVESFQLAVGKPDSPAQQVVMRVPGNDFTQASLKLQREGSWRETPQVREYASSITSVDAVVAERSLPKVDFIKIDVEGGELDVLEGGARTLTKHRPLVYCEVDERWTASFGYTSADLFRLFQRQGYAGARVFGDKGVSALALDSYTVSGLFDVSSNVLFFADSRREAIERFDVRFRVDRVP